MAKKYKLKYLLNWEHGEFTKEQIGTNGGTDALLITSILRGGKGVHDGSKSIAFIGLDGADPEAKQIPETEMFQVFSHLAYHLMQSERQIPEWQRTIAYATFEAVRNVITKN